MTKQQEVIAILNSLVKIKLAPSKIHGIGVFAMRKIPKGTKLYAAVYPQAYKVPYGSFRKLFPDVRQILLERWPNIVNDSIFMWPDTFLQGYMNHADEPNYDGINDITLQDIAEGEEILEDYRKIVGYEKVFPWLSPQAEK